MFTQVVAPPGAFLQSASVLQDIKPASGVTSVREHVVADGRLPKGGDEGGP